MSKLLLSVGLVFAVTAAGWSGVLAAGLCPHADCADAAAAARRAAPHCETSSSGDAHAATHDAPSRQGHEQAADAAAAGRANPASFNGAMGGHAASSSCAHCVGAPQSQAKDSPTVARSESRRDALSDAARAARRGVLPPVVSFPALAPSQGSPPGPAGPRRHLVLNTFLI
ncbi:MAG: hypothetical protein LC800_07780 [Acidobacteria bacterium]|nr:hypothetical protein [Acidobacteriota bacterium]